MNNQTFTIYFDEAWRGPLAWPLFIWLICPLKKLSKSELQVFCDSKKISEYIREEHFKLIQQLQDKKKIIYSPARVTATEIDLYGMTNAIHCAILRWMIQLFQNLYPNYFSFNLTLPDPLAKSISSSEKIQYKDVLSVFSSLYSNGIHIKLILDWNSNFWLWKSFPFREIQTVVHWDDTVKEISMASIIAKVTRDRIMRQWDEVYPEYGFAKHKGYGTAEHINVIRKIGPCKLHRKSFIKNFTKEEN